MQALAPRQSPRPARTPNSRHMQHVNQRLGALAPAARPAPQAAALARPCRLAARGAALTRPRMLRNIGVARQAPRRCANQVEAAETFHRRHERRQAARRQRRGLPVGLLWGRLMDSHAECRCSTAVPLAELMCQLLAAGSCVVPPAHWAGHGSPSRPAAVAASSSFLLRW